MCRAVADQGYITPTPIQAQAIPIILEGRDILGAAQTGTGKTASFTLPMLQRLGSRPAPASSGRIQPTRALVLVPTRELAAQVEASVRTYGKHLQLSTAVIFGGVGINPQIEAIKGGADIVVATPGRLLDHVEQRTIDLSNLEILVLDEADRMLDMGFIHDIRRVLKLLPAVRQNLLFSATFSDEIRQLASGFLNNPAAVDVARRNATAEAVAQVVHPVDASRKRELLAHLIKTGDWRQVLVFTRTKHGANRLAQQLEREGIEADAIHGNKSQNARTRALARFKANELQVLVATDIAARGLDIEELPHVVNYDIPNVSEDYVHRIGRTGRAGSSGEAVSLVSHDERGFMRDIERLIKREIEQRIIPGFEPSANPPPAPEDDRGPRPERRQGGGRNDNAPRGGGRNPGRGGRGGNQNRPSQQTNAAMPAAPEVDGNRLDGSQRPRATEDIDDNIGNRLSGHGAANSRMGSDVEPRNGSGNGRGRRGRRGGRRPAETSPGQTGAQAGADNFEDMENPPASYIEPGNRAPRVRIPDDIPDDIGNRAIDVKEPEIDDDIGNRIGYVPKNVNRFAQPGQERRNGPRNNVRGNARNPRAGQRSSAPGSLYSADRSVSGTQGPAADIDGNRINSNRIDGNRQRGPRRDGAAGGSARGQGRGPGGGQGRGPGRGQGRGPGRGNVGNEERGGRPAPIIGGSGLQAQQLRQPGDISPPAESNQNRPTRNEGRADRGPDRRTDRRPDRRPERGAGGDNATPDSRPPGQRPPGQRQPGARNAQGQRRQPGAGGRNPGNRNPARYDEVQPASHESALHKTAMGDRQGDREPQRKGLFGKVASLFSGGPRRDKGPAR